MSDPKIDVAVALEADEDFPVVDLIYDGEHWASATFKDGQLALMVYGHSAGVAPLPLDAAIESLERARRQLSEIMGGNET